jgi:hypothetical protein
VLSRGQREGYSTAKVEFLQDTEPENPEGQWHTFTLLLM